MDYEARDADTKLWVLGVREMATKAATDTLNVFQEILKAIYLACKSATTESHACCCKMLWQLCLAERRLRSHLTHCYKNVRKM